MRCGADRTKAADLDAVGSQLLIDEVSPFACAIRRVKDGNGSPVPKKVQHIVEGLQRKVSVRRVKGRVGV